MPRGDYVNKLSEYFSGCTIHSCRRSWRSISASSSLLQTNPNDPNSKPWPPAPEAITLEQGLKALTIDPAWQTRMEDKIGSLEEGKYADLVVLEKNLFDMKPNEISDVKVVVTMVGGKVTYRDGL